MAHIADLDTALVLEARHAYVRMCELGLSVDQVKAMLAAESATGASDEEVVFPAPEGWHGFKSRRQASLAATAGLRKTDRAAPIGDAHERVNTLIKNQKPEVQRTTIGLAIVSIPAMHQGELPEGSVKRVRRMANGKLKELTAIDVEAVTGDQGSQVEPAVVARKGA